MAAVNESAARRMTLGYLHSHYDLAVSPEFAMPVTVTSLADDLDSVRPGSLYMPNEAISAERLDEAQIRGAYAALVPDEQRSELDGGDIPLLFGHLTPDQMGGLAADVAGNPSQRLACFAVGGGHADEDARTLKEFLHMLGNPIGLISAAGSSSLDRPLNLEYPMSMFDVQRVLAVCAEDGASAVVLTMNERTLRPQALRSVSIDVIAVGDGLPGSGAERSTAIAQLAGRYGFDEHASGRLASRTEESDNMAGHAFEPRDPDSLNRLSLSIAMALVAGVRRSSIKGALRVSKELS